MCKQRKDEPEPPPKQREMSIERERELVTQNRKQTNNQHKPCSLAAARVVVVRER
jgi:hypothetical protein